ncbi:CorA family divalent cation transporter, partial [Staphylococcus haemolyticus]|uniref:CorA family divalent cation transporter n=1 Tax=Staphylococcus haemolyticus TaxID=1283 RepID=UPI003C6EA8FF
MNHSASWINVVEPDREEIEGLMEFYNIHEDFIRDPLDSEESARIEYDEDTGYSLIIIDLPIVNSTNRRVLSFVTIPLG